MSNHIVIITGSMLQGGAERVISILANNLVLRGWNVHIVSLLHHGCSYELDNRIELIDISNPNCNQIIDIPRMVLSIRKIIRNIRPNVVVSFMLTINIVSWIATRMMNVRFIPSERNDPNTGNSRLMRYLQRFVYAHSDLTIFQTQRAQKCFAEKIQDKSVVIPNPVNVSYRRSINTNKRIVSVGRLEAQKNHKLLIDSFDRLYKNHPDFTLAIYGEGNLRHSLEQQIKEKGLEKAVFLEGSVKNIHERISDAYMFVLSSDYEGLSNALLEAAAMGFPCISTNCFGSDDVIINGESGLLVPPGDKEALFTAMEYLIENPSQAERFGINILKNMDKYGTKAVVDCWENVIGSI